MKFQGDVLTLFFVSLTVLLINGHGKTNTTQLQRKICASSKNC